MKLPVQYLTFIISFLVSNFVWANSLVECGKTVDVDNFKVTGFELGISSGDDDYNGSVGGSWQLKFDESNWEAPNKNIKAKTIKNEDGTVTVHITVSMGSSPTGAVGKQYKIIDLYSDTPVLEKYTMGGFAGTLKTGTYQCISAID